MPEATVVGNILVRKTLVTCDESIKKDKTSESFRMLNTW